MAKSEDPLHERLAAQRQPVRELAHPAAEQLVHGQSALGVKHRLYFLLLLAYGLWTPRRKKVGAVPSALVWLIGPVAVLRRR